MRYEKLLLNGKTFTNQSDIEKIIKSREFYWITDSEIENANIEIKNNTIIWNDGYFFGNWKFGIFKGGKFYGNWENGIFESGEFNGNWKSGIRLDNQI
jgi:hypothetical protein